MVKAVRLNLIAMVLFLIPNQCYSRQSSEQLVSPGLLEHAKLKLVWDTKLPLHGSEDLEQIFILSNRIYVLSDHNYMVSLNRKNGKVVFSRPFAPIGLPVLGLSLYKDQVLSIAGNKLIQINHDFGTVLDSKALEFNAVCPAARNDSYFYIGGVDRRIHALRATDKVQIFQVASQSDSLATSVIADDAFIIFATKAGDVICIEPDKPRRLWQFNASDAVVGSIIRDEGSLFVASKDTNIYKIDIFTGELIWKSKTAVILETSPHIGQRAIYQNLGPNGLMAIDKESGKVLWQLAEGLGLLAESGEKSYVMTNNKMLVVMDNKEGRRLYSVNFARVSKYATNCLDSLIYITDDSGRIACIAPVE